MNDAVAGIELRFPQYKYQRVDSIEAVNQLGASGWRCSHFFMSYMGFPCYVMELEVWA